MATEERVMSIIYTDTVFLPSYGLELTITRKHGRRWWLVGSLDLEGNARERAREPRPTDSVEVTAYVRSAVSRYPKR
jgi:hypothetical protein